jgi:hypothetical protein
LIRQSLGEKSICCYIRLCTKVIRDSDRHDADETDEEDHHLAVAVWDDDDDDDNDDETIQEYTIAKKFLNDFYKTIAF